MKCPYQPHIARWLDNQCNRNLTAIRYGSLRYERGAVYMRQYGIRVNPGGIPNGVLYLRAFKEGVQDRIVPLANGLPGVDQFAKDRYEVGIFGKRLRKCLSVAGIPGLREVIGNVGSQRIGVRALTADRLVLVGHVIGRNVGEMYGTKLSLSYHTFYRSILLYTGILKDIAIDNQDDAGRRR